jgi:hypothetical protein
MSFVKNKVEKWREIGDFEDGGVRGEKDISVKGGTFGCYDFQTETRAVKMAAKFSGPVVKN